ncbi:ComF family protein [Enhygromyxa salina]|uniref:DNA utilization protein GntX n=1 Tax=Enhygromyxa salina TaxID=215803 RepID=A0A2S9XC11_9BACT|nr:ComF family protein [Enhygromyxa salina]PRP90395.1 DNA utilization protein GntX [Enhygromyxa salina]
MWAPLFPPICLGCERLLRHDRALALCSRCHPLQTRLPASLAEADGVRAVWSYDGPLSRSVVRLKFNGALALAGPLGRLLVAEPGVLNDCDLVASVPLHWRRRLARGFDQSEELSRWAIEHARRSMRARAPTLARRVLTRVRATQPQTRLDAPARAANVDGAFVVRRPEQVRGRRVLLIDDVTTTGATARACMHALREAGVASVTTLALLRAL